MPSGKQRRISEIKNRKKKKGRKRFFFLLIVVVSVCFLVFFFVTLFNSLYPPVAGKKEKEKVVLYFSDTNEQLLVLENRDIPKGKNNAEKATELVKALLEGSRKGLLNTFPKNVNLQSVKIEGGGTAYVSFGENLVKSHPGGSSGEMATIYSLTNTLTANIPGIKKVKILIEGK
ncbi:MAG: GerMN domain-containing protein, partial [Syntrophales bacterium]|nr:GerMN domain-containing protein [Syntrophales bacterium]